MLGGSWGEDGTILANLSREQVLWSLPAEGGTPEPLIDFSDEGVGPRWPQLLPGGRGVLYSAFVGIGSDSSIAVAELDGGRRTTLVARGTHARYLPSGHLVYSIAARCSRSLSTRRRCRCAASPCPSSGTWHR